MLGEDQEGCSPKRCDDAAMERSGLHADAEDPSYALLFQIIALLLLRR